MAILKFDNFTGVSPAVDPKRLGSNGAQVALNCLFEAGDVRPAPFSIVGSRLSNTTTITVAHWYNDGMLGFHAGSDVVNSPVIEDSYERVYWTTPTEFRFATNAQLAGHTDVVGVGQTLGVPALEVPPDVTSSSVNAREVVATQISNTTPALVTVGGDGHQFEDGQRVIATFEARQHANVDPTPPERTGMSELQGKTFTTRLMRDENTGVSSTTQFYLIGADGANYSTYSPSLWQATVQRVFTADDYESRSYVATLVSKYGEEGQPSPPSEVFDVVKGGAAAVQVNIPISISSQGYMLRLYRAVTGQSGTEFFFVKEVQVPVSGGALQITDDVPPERLGEMLQSEEWAAPPHGAIGLTAMPGGFLAAFKGNTLYFSEPYMPHAWPHAHRRTVQDEIVGLGVYGQTLVVATKGKPYLASGTDPASVSLQQLDTRAPCISKAAISSAGDGVIFPTMEGLVHVSGAGARLITASHFTAVQWRGTIVSTPAGDMAGIWHKGRYYLSSRAPNGDGTIWVFHPHSGGLHVSKFHDRSTTAHSTSFTHSFVVAKNRSSWRDQDSLWGVKVYPNGTGTTLDAMDTGSNCNMKWQSGIVTLGKHVSFACAQVQAESYPVQIHFYSPTVRNQQAAVNDLLVDNTGQTAAQPMFSKLVTGPEPFRLPATRLSREWRIDIEGKVGVQQVVLATSMDEIKQI